MTYSWAAYTKLGTQPWYTLALWWYRDRLKMFVMWYAMDCNGNFRCHEPKLMAALMTRRNPYCKTKHDAPEMPDISLCVLLRRLPLFQKWRMYENVWWSHASSNKGEVAKEELGLKALTEASNMSPLVWQKDFSQIVITVNLPNSLDFFGDPVGTVRWWTPGDVTLEVSNLDFGGRCQVSVPRALVALRKRANQLWGFQRLFSPWTRSKMQLYSFSWTPQKRCRPHELPSNFPV